MPSAEIIAIGSELLLGEIPDTNTQVIAHFLRSIGIDVFRTSIIGDNQQKVASLIREALDRCDVLITTGGLGPTVDDPTREAIAQTFQSELVFHPELWDIISERSKKHGRKASENLKKQAYIPEHAQIIDNPVGSAPGFIVIKKNRSVISLPGVPMEMETMLNRSVKTFLKEFYGLTGVIKLRVLHCAGASEGWIDEKVGDLEKLANPTVGLAAHDGQVDVRLTCKANNEQKAEKAINDLETEIRIRLGKVIFGVDQQTIEEVVLGLLKEKGWTLFIIWQLDNLDIHQGQIHLRESLNFLGDEIIDSNQDLKEKVGEKRDSFKNMVVMGISIRVDVEPYEISIFLDTPSQYFDRQTVFLGHPNFLSRYAFIMAFNHLRNILEK